MKFLLDTCVWLRANVEHETLPRPISELLAEEGQTFGLSAISIWEVGKKCQRGKLNISGDLLDWFRKAAAPPIEILPFTPEIAADAMHLKSFPNRDPVDELIVATARVHNLVLLTTDTALKKYHHAKIRYFTPILS